MRFFDEVYGEVAIHEPLLMELAHSKALVRLHGVLQHGITGLIGITKAITRYDHSLGVMSLVRRLDGTVEEQAAALIHDASHTAFSHVVDYVFHGHTEQDYHEAKKEEYLSTTDIPEIMQTHGRDWRYFLDDEKFPLLEQPAPALCADRLDYFLRDALGLGIATQEEVMQALEHLVVFDRRVAVDHVDAARWLAYKYIDADKTSWANFREVALYELTAMAIRRGMEIDQIRESDLWQSDAHLWSLLKNSRDPVIQKHLSHVNKQTTFVWDSEHSDFVVKTKIRTIDPDVLVRGSLIKLSRLDASFARYAQEYVDKGSEEWPVRIVD